MKPRTLVLVLAALMLPLGSWVRTESKVNNLTQARGCGSFSSEPLDEAEREARDKRYWQFVKLWQNRHEPQSKIVPALLPYLEDPTEGIRTRAIRALGRTESQQAALILERLAMRTNLNMSDSIGWREPLPALTLRLALARVQARQLVGQAKLDTMSQAAHLSWREVIRLSQKVNAAYHGGEATFSTTPGTYILEEIVDALYAMGKSGTPIEQWASQLTLDPAQEMKLEAAHLTTQQELALLLERMSHPDGTKDSATKMEDYVVAIGAQGRDAVIQKIRHMLEYPNLYTQPLGYKMVFNTAALAADRRALPLLERFAHNPDPTIQEYAHKATSYINYKYLFPNVP